MNINIVLNSPYPDFRYGARSHALLNNNLDVFIPDKKDKIRSKLTNKEYNKISYYNSIIGINHVSNTQVVYNFSITGSRIFREFLKSIPGIYIESGEDIDEISNEFSVDGEFNKLCNFNLSINLYILMQLLKYMETKVNLFYNFYGTRFIDSIDNAIKSQIKVPKVMSKLYNMASKIIEIRDIVSYINNKSECTLSELSDYNNSDNIKLYGLIEYIENIDKLDTRSFSGLDKIPYTLRELKFHGLLHELEDMCCSLNNLTSSKLELLESYINSEDKLLELFKCKLDKSKCNYVDRQNINLIEQNKICPILINKLNIYKDNKITKLIKSIKNK